MPNKFNTPDKKISDLEKIWNGEELSRIRTCHSQDKVSGLDVCLKCTFKDTYSWKEI